MDVEFLLDAEKEIDELDLHYLHLASTFCSRKFRQQIISILCPEQPSNSIGAGSSSDTESWKSMPSMDSPWVDPLLTKASMVSVQLAQIIEVSTDNEAEYLEQLWRQMEAARAAEDEPLIRAYLEVILQLGLDIDFDLEFDTRYLPL